MAGFVMPSAPLQSPSFSLPTTTVELSVRCSNLADCDILSKSDPVAIIFGKVKGHAEWRELWRSELVLNELNPMFKKRMVHDYRFEEHQPIKVDIYDWDTDDPGVSKTLAEQDLIGRIETTMAALVSASNKQWTAVLRSKQNKGAGTITITTEEVTSNKEVVEIHLAAKDLDKKDFFGKSDPFVVISRSSPMVTGKMSFIEVHRTDVVKNTLKPNWK